MAHNSRRNKQRVPGKIRRTVPLPMAMAKKDGHVGAKKNVRQSDIVIRLRAQGRG